MVETVQEAMHIMCPLCVSTLNTVHFEIELLISWGLKASNLVNAGPGIDIGEKIAKENWGEAASHPIAVWNSVCSV